MQVFRRLRFIRISQLKKSIPLCPKKNINLAVFLIKGVICGVRVEDIKDPIMQEIRYLDKLIDELAKGRPMKKILRSNL